MLCQAGQAPAQGMAVWHQVQLLKGNTPQRPRQYLITYIFQTICSVEARRGTHGYRDSITRPEQLAAAKDPLQIA